MLDDNKLHDTHIIQSLNLESDSEIALEHAIELIFDSSEDKNGKIQAIGYIKKPGFLYLFSYDERLREHHNKNYKELPFPLNKKNAFNFVKEWLYSVPNCDRRTECDGGDGSHGLGYILSTGWNHLQEDADKFNCYDWDIILRIEAFNIYYSK